MIITVFIEIGKENRLNQGSSSVAFLCKDSVPKILNKYPINETVLPRSQFLLSCICERFINSYDRSTNILLQQNM
jgi:hypothetical protein